MYRRATAAFVLAAVSAWSGRVLAQDEARRAQPLVEDGAWCWFADTRAVLWMQGTYDYWTDYKTRLVAWPMK